MSICKWLRSLLNTHLFSALFCAVVLNANCFASNDLLSSEQRGEEKQTTGLKEEPKGKQSSEIERSAIAQKHFDEIEEVLAREEFGKTKHVKAWRLIDSEDEEARKEKFPEWLIKLFEWLEKRSASKGDNESSISSINFALILEVILWSLAIGLVLLVAIKYRKQIANLKGLLKRTERNEPLPTTMFGLDIKKESLPDDIVGSAQKYWQDGEPRLAIAMLLRASLINLLNDHDCVFYDSDTETECCLRIDKQVTPPLSRFMSRLVAIWQKVAYAHRTPSDADFDSLCFEWEEVFS